MSFAGGIAVAASDYVGQSNVLLTFNAATRSIDVSVNLIDDNVHEGEEDFSGTLTLVTDSQRVAIVQGSAVATIVDDESEQRPAKLLLAKLILLLTEFIIIIVLPLQFTKDNYLHTLVLYTANLKIYFL